MSELQIAHDPANRRFSTQVDGHTGYVSYTLDDGVLSLDHTIVPSPIGGRGIAGKLVQATLEHAREQGWKVRPSCSYADTWMRRHPQFEDLRA